MRLKYRILWFENDPDFVKEVGPDITAYLLDDLGLELEIDEQSNGIRLGNLLRDGGPYDLIVTDLNLDNGDTGKDLIDKIRADQVLTEVLLYSGTDADIQKIIAETPGLERVSYAVGRPALPERLKRIIALTVRKVQDVHNMRGLVIAEAIDLEDKMLDIITSHFKTSIDDMAKAGFIKDHYEKTDSYFQSRLKKLAGHTPEKILEFVETACGEMMPKYIALNKLLDSAKAAVDTSTDEGKEKLKVLEVLETELEKMNEDVINLRNDLAHVREEKDASGKWILKNKKQMRETVFDDAKYVEIRRNLRSHFDNLTKIADQLS